MFLRHLQNGPATVFGIIKNRLAGIHLTGVFYRQNTVAINHLYICNFDLINAVGQRGEALFISVFYIERQLRAPINPAINS